MEPTTANHEFLNFDPDTYYDYCSGVIVGYSVIIIPFQTNGYG